VDMISNEIRAQLRQEARHCGYANYETFTVALVIDNDRRLISHARAIAPDGPEALRGWVEQRFIDPVCQEGVTNHGMAATLCAYAFASVDWVELCEEWTKPEGA
jgi:hypothetical protein